MTPRRTALAIALALSLAGATGAVAAGWSTHGVSIFMTLAEAGLAWCL